MSTATHSGPSWRIFDGIAGTYDRVNTVLSMGTDRLWRRALRRALPVGEGLEVLDVATGTGEVAFELLQEPRVARVHGVDASVEMLEMARSKNPHGERVRFDHMDGMALDIEDDTYDAATIAFGIRNLPDARGGLAELRRVVRPGGKVLVLEFSLPRSAVIRGPYLAYFRHVLPRVGGLVSGDVEAYRYLNATVEAFPYGEAFAALMREVGLREVKHRALSFGIATLYEGTA